MNLQHYLDEVAKAEDFCNRAVTDSEIDIAFEMLDNARANLNTFIKQQKLIQEEEAGC